MIENARFNVNAESNVIGSRWKAERGKHAWYCKPHADITADRLNSKERAEKGFISVPDYFNIIGAKT